MAKDDVDAYVDQMLALVCRDLNARRELLWLRAMESGDEFTVELVERGDPALRPRMLALLEGRDQGRTVYAAVWEERFAELARRALSQRTEEAAREGPDPELPVADSR